MVSRRRRPVTRRREIARGTFDLEPLERRDCPAALGVAASSASFAEVGGAATFTVRLDAPVARPVTVGYFVGGSAKFAADYRMAIGTAQIGATGTLTFAAGERSKTITVRAVDDLAREGSESVTFNLLAPRNATLGPRTATMTMLDNDAYTATIVQRGAAVPGGPARFTLTLSSPATQTERFSVTTSDGTSLAGRDFQPLAQAPLVILPGQTSKDFWVPVLPGATGTFFVGVDAASPGFPGIAPLPVTIGGAGVGALVVSDASVFEGNAGTKQMVFTVALTAAVAVPVTVDYATADGYATVADGDYQSATGTLTFAPGGPLAQTIAVTVVGDTRLEADETLSLTLSNADGAAVSKGTGTGTIRNDEAGYVPQPVPWTILVYMTGDNLNDFAFEDINEMEAALAKAAPGVRVVVSWDQPPAGDADAYATGGGAQAPWRTYGRSILRGDADRTTITSSFDTSFGEKNTGDPATLVDFVKWATLRAPADRYMLQMWGHGGGLDGSQFDSESRNDALTIGEIASALAAPGMPTFDVVSYDNCLMGMAEVGYAIAPKVTGRFVASEELVNGTGQDYTTAWSAIMASPRTATAATIGAGMVSSFDTQYKDDPDLCDTYSSVVTAGYTQLATALSQFVTDAAANLTDADRATLQAAANAAPNYGDVTPTSFVDLGQFMAFAGANVPALQAAATAVNAAIGSMVAAKTGDQRESSGISIYLPTGPDDPYLDTYDRTAAAFCAATRWNLFTDWFAGPAGGAARGAAARVAAPAGRAEPFASARTAIDWAAYAAFRSTTPDDAPPGGRTRVRLAAARA